MREPRQPIAPIATSGPLEVSSKPSFEQVYADHFPFVWRCLRLCGVREDGLDDAVQEVFVVVHRRLAEFRGEANLRTWIYRILLNVAANQRRRERRKGSRQAPLEEGSLASADTPQESAQTSQAAAFLHGFLAGLDVKKREVFVLAAIEELPVPEVAAMLDIPLNTAYTRLRSARLAFQAALAARRGSP